VLFTSRLLAPTAAGAALDSARGRRVAIGRRCWCCAGSFPRQRPASASWLETTPSGARRPTDTCPRASTCWPRRRPDCGRILLAARVAGHLHLTVEGTLVHTDRCPVPGSTARATRANARVDLCWSASMARTAAISRFQPPGRLPDFDLTGAAQPRARHHRAARPSVGPAAAS